MDVVALLIFTVVLCGWGAWIAVRAERTGCTDKPDGNEETRL